MKYRRIFKYLYSTTLLIALAGCAQTPVTVSWEPNKAHKLTILHTNDHHGHFWKNKHGEYGMAARKTLIDRIRTEVRDEGGSLLLLSAGDINSGVPESDLQNAEPDFKGMSLLGYDAMALGNHEFDKPLSVLEQQQQWAHFPMLSANIYNKTTGTRKYQAYQIFNRQDIKVAVIGLTTENTGRFSKYEDMKNLEFRDPRTEATQLIAQIKKTEAPDLIFILSHIGYGEKEKRKNAKGDIALAHLLDKNDVDGIIGGHSQEPVCMDMSNHRDGNYQPTEKCIPDQQNGIFIMQAHEWGKYVGRADYIFYNGTLTLENYQLIPVNLKKEVQINGRTQHVFYAEEIPEDASMLDLLRLYQKKAQAQLLLKIAETTGKLEGDRDKVRSQQTSLGRLIARAYKERTRADFGIVYGGGVRDSIETGDITYRDILAVHPFKDTLCYVDMSGKEILDYLSIVATKPAHSGAYAQFSGLSMTIKGDTISQLVINGKPIEMKKTYRFALPHHIAMGGGAYPKITQHPRFVDTGIIDAEVLRNFLKSLYLKIGKAIDPAQFAPKGEIRYQ